MRLLKIELLPPRRVPVGWVAAVVVVMAAALALTLAAGSLAREAHEARRLGQELRVRVEQERQEATARSEALPVKTVPYEEDARRVERAGRLSVAEALVALEHVALVGVTPIAVTLDGDAGQVTADVEYSDQDRLLKYLSELNAGEELPRWRLLRAAAKVSAQSGAGVATLESHW